MIGTDFTTKPVYDALKAWTGGATTATTTPTTVAPTTTSTVAPTTTTTAPATTTVPPPTTTTTVPTAVDRTAPLISSVRVGATSTAATVTWITNEASSTEVTFRSASGVATTVNGADNVTSHIVDLTGLRSKTSYSFTVRSADAAGNVSTSPAYSFKTTR